MRQTSGRSTRSSSRRGQRASPPNSTPSAVADALPTPTPPVVSSGQRARKSRRAAACGKYVCGRWSPRDACQACHGSPPHTGHFFCCACRDRPLESSGRVHWRHFKDVDDVRAATATRNTKIGGGGGGCSDCQEGGVSVVGRLLLETGMHAHLGGQMAQSGRATAIRQDLYDLRCEEV